MYQFIAIFAAGFVGATTPTYPSGCPDYCDQNTITRAELPADRPKFKDYSVATKARIKPVKANFNSNPKARLYRSMITDGEAQGPNFAGHYTLASWGCGADCSQWAIIDAATGRIFTPLNFETNVSVTVDDALWEKGQGFVHFRLDSRLIEVDGDINENPEMRGITYFIWDGRVLKTVRFIAHPFIVHPNGADKR